MAINLAAVFIVQFFWDPLNSVLPYADYVLCNEDEAAAFAEKSGWDVSCCSQAFSNLQKNDLEGVAAKLSQLPKLNDKRPRTVVFTQGPKPTIVAVDGEVKYVSLPTTPHRRKDLPCTPY